MPARNINIENTVAWVHTTRSDDTIELLRAAVEAKLGLIGVGKKGLSKIEPVQRPPKGWPAGVTFNQRGVLEWIGSVQSAKELPESATPGERESARRNCYALCQLHLALAERDKANAAK